MFAILIHIFLNKAVLPQISNLILSNHLCFYIPTSRIVKYRVGKVNDKLRELIVFGIIQILENFLQFIIFNHCMITFKYKKQKLVLRKSTNGMLKINNHNPILPNLNILKITPPKSHQNSSISKSKSNMQVKVQMKVDQQRYNNSERRVNIRSKSCIFVNVKKKEEKNSRILQLQLNRQKQLSSHNYVNQIQENQGAERQIQPEQKKIKDQQKDQQTNSFQRRSRRDTQQPASQFFIPVCNFTICHVINQSIFKETQYFENVNQCFYEQPQNKTVLYEQSDQLQTEAQCNQLNELIERKQKIIEQRQREINQAQEKIGRLKIIVRNLEKQAQKYNECKKKNNQIKVQLESFLYNQSHLILRNQAKGYKESQQALFDLANRLEHSTYQKMLEHLYGQLDVREKSFYNLIENFQIEPNENSNAKLKKFKYNINKIHDHILSKIKDVLRLKSEKIQQFVKTLKRLASYRIGKRQYLSEVYKKITSLSVLLNTQFLQIEPLFQQNLDKLQTIKSIVDSIRKCHKEAQTFC